MTLEQIAAVFAGLTGLVTAIGGILLGVGRRRSDDSDQLRQQLEARRAKESARDRHDESVAQWRVQIRVYIARLRELLADKGVTVDNPPAYPEPPPDSPGRTETT